MGSDLPRPGEERILFEQQKHLEEQKRLEDEARKEAMKRQEEEHLRRMQQQGERRPR